MALHGELTPQIVVDAAREEDSPLHPHFEWDYELAAERWLIEQARDLIRKARVKIIREDGQTVRVRAYLALTTEDKRPIYVKTEVIGQDEAMRAQVLQQMERDWKALRRKYDQYEEFWTLIDQQRHGLDGRG